MCTRFVLRAKAAVVVQFLNVTSCDGQGTQQLSQRVSGSPSCKVHLLSDSYTWEELLLVSGTEALASEARLLHLVEQSHGIIFG